MCPVIATPRERVASDGGTREGVERAMPAETNRPTHAPYEHHAQLPPIRHLRTRAQAADANLSSSAVHSVAADNNDVMTETTGTVEKRRSIKRPKSCEDDGEIW